MKNSAIYNCFADLLSYPKENYRNIIHNCESILSQAYLSVNSPYHIFSDYVSKHDLNELEEKYTSTFDINAICTLDVGYQLFGEDYKRGALLVELSRLHKEVGNPTGCELSDHLSNLLRLIPLIKNSEEREELVKKLILPAVEKMISSFVSENIYQNPLKSLYGVLKKDFGEPVPFPVNPDYLAEVEEAMHV